MFDMIVATWHSTSSNKVVSMELHPDWEYVADAVMGGVSQGRMSCEDYRGRKATVLRGNVSLDNNGGFIQIAFDLCPDGSAFDASAWNGIALDLCGNGETYDIRLRTDPWQSFRVSVTATEDWRTHIVPFETVTPHRTDVAFDPSGLRRIGILAIGREFHAEIAVAGVRLCRC
ncbi:CIA30 family protein [Roseivivax sp. GX 12232]|uniref:CIA30 family protein n=1 Tax=Roseivivax sp. GX 12232 TaxID=2900547 RepID=UPI00351D686E